MELRDIGQRLYNVLCNAFTANNGRPFFVEISDVMLAINENVRIPVTKEEVIGVILNDPFRQKDAFGIVRQDSSLFEPGRTNDVITSVSMSERAYNYPQDWGLK
ncbi:hypothetical protein D9980_05385 [Serratia sp. 3ACOL1]|uniref:hypothetical protein n=1 Tax=Serratia sp. 3ACOL1 TaxID=2448483 RepID=UPI000EF4DC8C|nr:hypothetical protein [Serratia sp. 3ACOL1]AYM90057.1 hypothetical protein D9980_05385 [Serratia sp. 3ACOL1]